MRSPATKLRLIGTRLAVYGLVGLVLTIGVAWGIAAFLPFSQQSRLVKTGGFPRAWQPPGEVAAHGFVVRRPGYTNWQLFSEGLQPNGYDWITLVSQRGFPVPALETVSLYDWRVGKHLTSPFMHGIPIPMEWQQHWMRANQVYTSKLPLRPVWYGLAIDTVVWGAVAFGVVRSVGGLRAVVRRRRRECDRCGYRLDGLDVCPECGSPALASAARPGNGP